MERTGAGGAKHVLSEHVERAWPRRRRVLRAFRRCFQRRLALNHLEAIGRDEQSLARLIEPVIRAADALGKPARTLRRADIDHEIDIAPVDAEIERRGAHHGAELASHHRRLDLAALRHVERAVMQRDRQIVVVAAPKLVEQQLGLRARIDEDQRHAVSFDRLVYLGQRITGGVSRPRQLGLGSDDGDVGFGALARPHDLGEPRRSLALVGHEKGGKVERTRHGRRQADRGELWRMGAEPGEIERKQIAALARCKRMQLIEEHIFEGAEQLGGTAMRQHEGNLLGRGEEDVGRQQPLARPA